MQRRVVLGLNDIVNSIGGVLNGAMSVWSGEAKANSPSMEFLAPN